MATVGGVNILSRSGDFEKSVLTKEYNEGNFVKNLRPNSKLRS